MCRRSSWQLAPQWPMCARCRASSPVRWGPSAPFTEQGADVQRGEVCWLEETGQGFSPQSLLEHQPCCVIFQPPEAPAFPGSWAHPLSSKLAAQHIEVPLSYSEPPLSSQKDARNS